MQLGSIWSIVGLVLSFPIAVKSGMDAAGLHAAFVDGAAQVAIQIAAVLGIPMLAISKPVISKK